MVPLHQGRIPCHTLSHVAGSNEEEMTDQEFIDWAFSQAPQMEEKIHWVHGFITGMYEAGGIKTPLFNRVIEAVASVAIEH